MTRIITKSDGCLSTHQGSVFPTHFQLSNQVNIEANRSMTHPFSQNIDSAVAGHGYCYTTQYFYLNIM